LEVVVVLLGMVLQVTLDLMVDPVVDPEVTGVELQLTEDRLLELD
jgi:hypothetical protein